MHGLRNPIQYAAKGLCVAGTHSGCGKTTVTLGIMAALAGRGHTVQGFKVGPDFIDPGHHKRVTGRDSHNLDGWMLGQRSSVEIFARYLQDADIAVVEGVMGLFDGFSGADDTGSTAQMAKWLRLPVVLVIDAGSMARSAAAVALGYSRFDRDLSLHGVIFNRVGSKAHADMLRDAMKAVPGLPVLGCLPRQEDLEIPSRHLGLVTAQDLHPDDEMSRRLAGWVEDHMDVEELPAAIEYRPPPHSDAPRGRKTTVRIGIAADEAFCFYYPDNLRLLRESGAELVPFSPLRSECLPEGVKGLILGGGYPELHCRTLAENRYLLAEIREFGLEGRPIYAECGGFMFLTETIRDLQDESHPMVGLFPVATRMQNRLRSLGYREIETQEDCILGPAGTRIRGHEFHYSHIRGRAALPTVYTMTDRNGCVPYREGFLLNRVLGSYIHLHWGSNPEAARSLVEYCERFG